MKSFRFRPESVLDLRRRRRDVAQAALGTAVRILHDAEAELLLKTTDLRRATDAYHASLETEGDVSIHERHRNWIARMRDEIERLHGFVDERRKDVEAAAAVLRAAHQDVRVLERLKDHQRRRYDELARQEELKDMDQTASLRYVRRLMEGGQHGH